MCGWLSYTMRPSGSLSVEIRISPPGCGCRRGLAGNMHVVLGVSCVRLSFKCNYLHLLRCVSPWGPPFKEVHLQFARSSDAFFYTQDLHYYAVRILLRMHTTFKGALVLIGTVRFLKSIFKQFQWHIFSNKQKRSFRNDVNHQNSCVRKTALIKLSYYNISNLLYIHSFSKPVKRIATTRLFLLF